MTDMQGSENPLLKTLPPATDYLNYLIVVEHNLTKEQLPALHTVLQDTTLTANIGWDLVHLLLPFLPESKECLQDVARLGNPREVVLKVSELLGEIKAEDEEEIEDQEEINGTPNKEKEAQADTAPSGSKLKEDSVSGDVPQDASEREPALVQIQDKLSPQTLRYVHLVQMLSILHPRIKTKYPSRFLSTSLQAVLPAYACVAQDALATEATLDLIKSLSPTQRPKLPPRKSSSNIPTVASAPVSAPDPEGQPEAQGPDEGALQARLMQSFLTFVVEGYVSSLKTYEDIPGLAWSCRYYEKAFPAKRIPGRTSYLQMFVEEEQELHTRDAIVGQCLAIVRDLKLDTKELLSTISQKDSLEDEDEDALPSKASDVPLSRNGSLYLICASAASSSLFDAPKTLPTLPLFPDFANILVNCLSGEASDVVGGEPDATIDAILFLGSLIASEKPVIDPPNYDAFHSCLQRLSLLSANTSSAPLRYQAHLLTSNLLHMHPSPQNRLAFIKDTLEHCPIENLKASAVGWLKDEILAAQNQSAPADQGEPSIFATQATLATTAPLLLIDPSVILHDNKTSPSSATRDPSQQQIETYAAFQSHQSFILAVLNFLYLLLSSPSLLDTLSIKSMGKEFDIIGYCDRMRAASLLFQGWLSRLTNGNDDDTDKKVSGDEETNFRLAELQLLDQTIERVMEAAGAAGFK